MEVAPQCSKRCRSHSHGSRAVAAVLRGTENEVVAYLQWLCKKCGQVKDCFGRTALHMAASRGRRLVGEWLVKQKDAIINARDKESGYTPLHRSLFYGQIHCAVSLVQMGANVGSLDQEDLTPLDHAMKSRPAFVEFSSSSPCEAYVWGNNTNFNLGLGHEQERQVPELMEHFRRLGISIKQVSMNMFHTVLVSHSGCVYSCGHGQGGRLGQGGEKPSLTPRSMKLTATEKCMQASVGTDHTVLLMENGGVWTCGSNDHHQLGIGPFSKAQFQPRPLPWKTLPKNVLGVCAAACHTVIWGPDGLRTCGLNAGQLGHPRGERISVPKPVQASQMKYAKITHVATSSGATVVVAKKGTIHVLHEYQCRIIASRLLNVKQVVVTGGQLDSALEQSEQSEELKIVVLTGTGKLLLWQQSTHQLNRCMLQLKRLIIITEVTLTNNRLLFITTDGEAFEGFVRPKKEANVGKGGLGTGKGHEEFEQVGVRRLPHVHRAVSLCSDPRGRNFAIVQAHPKNCLLEIPQEGESNMRTQLATLLAEASDDDNIHDVIFEVGFRRFAAHRCVVGSCSETLLQLMAEAFNTQDSDVPVVQLTSMQPEVFEQILKFIYTNQCDFLVPGPSKVKFEEEKTRLKKKSSTEATPKYDPEKVSAFQVHQEKNQKNQNKKKREEANGNPDPLRGVAANARKLGVVALSKALEGMQYRSGIIEVKSGYEVYSPPALCFDKEKLEELCDVTIISVEGRETRAHRAILAARLEYFHSMFAHGWAESNRGATLNMSLPFTVLQSLLHFLYSDNATQVAEDGELARSLLVVADQMFVARLKDQCEVALAGTMTLKNSAELLQFAATYNAAQLKLCAMQFVSLNLSAFIESRSLEEVHWEVLDELTAYHRDFTPSMCHRTITPYNQEPTNAEMENVAFYFPVLLDQDWHSKKENLKGAEIKKSKPKKHKHRVHRISLSEVTVSRARQESISSNTSEILQDPDKDVPPSPSEEMEELPLLQDVITLCRISSPAPVENKPEEGRSQWDSMFPDLEMSFTDANSVKPKAVVVKKVSAKLSQKQRKRLLSEPPEVVLATVAPKPAWGLPVASPDLEVSGQHSEMGLGDIMDEERRQSRAIPVPSVARQRTTSASSIASPQSPTGVAWTCSSANQSMPSFLQHSSGSKPSSASAFLDIMQDEQQQKYNLRRVTTKPLNMTQLEDRAMEELRSFYSADEAWEERITVLRVDAGVIATPIWVSKH